MRTLKLLLSTSILLGAATSSSWAINAGDACSTAGQTARSGTASKGNVLICNGSTYVGVLEYGLTGEISIKTPTADAHAATKKYVDDLVSGGGSLWSNITPTMVGTPYQENSRILVSGTTPIYGLSVDITPAGSGLIARQIGFSENGSKKHCRSRIFRLKRWIKSNA